VIRKNSVAYVKINVLRFRKFAVSVHPIEFYFSFPFGTRYGNGNDAAERQCGHGLRKRLRIRMNGNVMLETRHKRVPMRFNSTQLTPGFQHYVSIHPYPFP